MCIMSDVSAQSREPFGDDMLVAYGRRHCSNPVKIAERQHCTQFSNGVVLVIVAVDAVVKPPFLVVGGLEHDPIADTSIRICKNVQPNVR